LRWSPADLAALRFAGRSLRTRRNKALWARDPVAWAHDRLGEHCWSKQAEALHSVASGPRTAVQSCHGVGKSHLASRAGLHYIDTADHIGDRFLVTTAPTSAQVKAILWRYIRQGHGKGGLVGRVMQTAEWKMPAASGDELVGYGRKPADWQTSAFQGIHAPEGVMVVIDEACGVGKQLFVDADALATTDASRVLAIGNPDDNASHFHTVCSGAERGWNTIKISAFDSPNLTGEKVPAEVARALVSAGWVEDKRQRWGESNPLYIAKVLGEFADSDDGLIPLSWVRAAHARWHTWHDNPLRHTHEPHGRRVFGVDVAWKGEDKTAVATRQGRIVLGVERWAKLDTTQTTGIVQAKLRGHPTSHAAVDVVGVGAGVYDQLSRAGASVSAFNASKPTRRRDASGEWRFSNIRSASWYNLRELLDPALGGELALPEDDDLTADLTTPKYEPRAGGIIHVETKKEIRARLGHSPDSGDATAISCWVDTPDRDDDAPPAEVIAPAGIYRPGHDLPRDHPVLVGAPADDEPADGDDWL
jgi:hypothetical protein